MRNKLSSFWKKAAGLFKRRLKRPPQGELTQGDLPPLPPLHDRQKWEDEDSKLFVPTESFPQTPEKTRSQFFTRHFSFKPEQTRQFINQVKKMDWGKLPDAIFSPANRTVVQRWFVLASLAVLCYTGGKMAALLFNLAGPSESGDGGRGVRPAPNTDGADIQAIRAANLFRTETQTQGPKKVGVSNERCADAKQNSGLPIKLINTVVLQDSVKSMASVQLRATPELMEVREGDAIEQIAKVDKIERLKIIIRNLQNNMCESVANEEPDAAMATNVLSPTQGKALIASQKPKGIVSDGNKFKIDKKVLDEKLSNLQEILTQARAVQINNPDGTLAFRMTDIQPGSIYTYLGLENNDIIREINGKKISSLNEIMGLFSRLQKKELSNLQLTIGRSGSDEMLDYQFNN